MQKVFLKVVGSTFELPNVTVGFARFEEIKTGWVVRVKDAVNFEGEDGMYRAIHAALETTKTVSGYKDEEIELWDVVEVFETEAEAVKAGRRNGQMTIYQIETGRLKWIW